MKRQFKTTLLYLTFLLAGATMFIACSEDDGNLEAFEIHRPSTETTNQFDKSHYGLYKGYIYSENSLGLVKIDFFQWKRRSEVVFESRRPYENAG